MERRGIGPLGGRKRNMGGSKSGQEATRLITLCGEEEPYWE